MRRCIILVFMFCFLATMTYGKKPMYDINAYEGTYFYCCLKDSITYPSICRGIILNCDSTLLNLNNEELFYKSLYENTKYVQDGELFYAQAYNIIFPDTSGNIENYEIAQDLRMNFNYLFGINQKIEEFNLSSDKNIEISFCKVKGIFLSVYDENISNRFCTSLDVPKTLMPPIKSVNIPLAIFECSMSNHQFYISR